MTEVKPVTLAFTCCKPEKDSKPDLPPIILHHGFTSSKERWQCIQQDLANTTGRTVYAIDARNHGSSERSDIFNFDVLPIDLKHFMDTHNIPKAVLIGHSMGGLAVMALALEEPEMVEVLIVEDVSPKEPEPELYYVFGAMIEEQLKVFEQSTSADTTGSIQQKLRETLYRTIPMIPDEDQEVIEKMMFPIKSGPNGFEPETNLKALLKALHNPPIYHSPKPSSYHKFAGETRFFYGTKSYFSVIEDQDTILKLFPHAHFWSMDAGHEICPRHPKDFIEKINQLL